MTSLPNLSNGIWNEIPLENYFHMKLNPTFDEGPFNTVIKRRTFEPEMPGEKYNSIISLLSDPGQPTFLSLLPCFFYLWVPILYLLKNIKWINTGKVLGRLLGIKIDSNMHLLFGYSIPLPLVSWWTPWYSLHYGINCNVQ